MINHYGKVFSIVTSELINPVIGMDINQFHFGKMKIINIFDLGESNYVIKAIDKDNIEHLFEIGEWGKSIFPEEELPFYISDFSKLYNQFRAICIDYLDSASVKNLYGGTLVSGTYEDDLCNVSSDFNQALSIIKELRANNYDFETVIKRINVNNNMVITDKEINLKIKQEIAKIEKEIVQSNHMFNEKNKEYISYASKCYKLSSIEDYVAYSLSSEHETLLNGVIKSCNSIKDYNKIEDETLINSLFDKKDGEYANDYLQNCFNDSDSIKDNANYRKDFENKVINIKETLEHYYKNVKEKIKIYENELKDLKKDIKNLSNKEHELTSKKINFNLDEEIQNEIVKLIKNLNTYTVQNLYIKG